MRAIGNKVLIKPDWGAKEEYDLGGVTISRQLNLIARKLEANCVTGIVVAVPSGKMRDDYGDEYEMELEVGDYVYCHHFAFQGASFDKMDFVLDNGEEVYPVNYYDCFFVRKGEGDYKMLNGYCLTEVLYDSNFTSSFLITPDTSKTVRKDKGIVRYACTKANHLIDKEVYLKDAYSCYDIEIDGKKFFRVRYNNKYSGDIIGYDE